MGLLQVLVELGGTPYDCPCTVYMTVVCDFHSLFQNSFDLGARMGASEMGLLQVLVELRWNPCDCLGFGGDCICDWRWSSWERRREAFLNYAFVVLHGFKENSPALFKSPLLYPSYFNEILETGFILVVAYIFGH